MVTIIMLHGLYEGVVERCCFQVPFEKNVIKFKLSGQKLLSPFWLNVSTPNTCLAVSRVMLGTFFFVEREQRIIKLTASWTVERGLNNRAYMEL